MSDLAGRLHLPVAVLEADSTLLHVNDAAADAMKQTPERLIGRRMLDLVHPMDHPRVDREFRRVVVGGLSGGMDVFRVCVDPFEPWRTLEVIVDNLLDNPTIAGILVSCRDVTKETSGLP